MDARSSLPSLLERTAQRFKSGTARTALVALLGISQSNCGIVEVNGDTAFIQVPVSLARDGSAPAEAGTPDAAAPVDGAPGDMVDASMPPVDTGNDVVMGTDVTDAGVDGGMRSDVVDAATPPVDVPVDTGPSCTPTSIVVGNDNVIVAANGNNVPVVINFSGECPTLGTGAVQARLSAGGAPFPMFGVTMNTLESSRARGVMNLTTPELTGFPLNTYVARDGMDNPLTGNMFPAGFNLPVNFVVDRVAPIMTAVTMASFDRGARMYNFAFTGDSNGKVVFDVRVNGDGGVPRSLLTHGTRNTCTLSRGTVPGRSVSTGCGTDTMGGSQSCVNLDGSLVCESDRLIFPVTASVRTVHTINSIDYNAVMDSTPDRTPITIVWTYVDERGNSTQGTRSALVLQ